MRAAIIVAGLLAACSHHHAPAEPASNSSVQLPRPSGGSLDQSPTSALVPGSTYLGERMLCIDRELVRLGLNEYGDPMGTIYVNGSPLRNEVTGTVTNRYDYVLAHRLDIAVRCSRAPNEPER